MYIYMKKLVLDSDWLRVVQFKGNTSAKSVHCNTSANYAFIILEYDWLKDNWKFSKPMISCKCKMTMIILCRNFEKSFFECEKNDKGRSSGTCVFFFSCLYYFQVIIRFFLFNLQFNLHL